MSIWIFQQIFTFTLYTVNQLYKIDLFNCINFLLFFLIGAKLNFQIVMNFHLEFVRLFIYPNKENTKKKICSDDEVVNRVYRVVDTDDHMIC